MEDEQIKIKVYVCREECPPIQIYQLSANGQDEYRALLKHLELFDKNINELLKEHNFLF